MKFSFPRGTDAYLLFGTSFQHMKLTIQRLLSSVAESLLMQTQLQRCSSERCAGQVDIALTGACRRPTLPHIGNMAISGLDNETNTVLGHLCCLTQVKIEVTKEHRPSHCASTKQRSSTAHHPPIQHR